VRILLVAIAALFLVQYAWADTHYVNVTEGLDSYDGLHAHHTTGNQGPWKTLNYADGRVSGGDSLRVAPGVYYITDTVVFDNANMVVAAWGRGVIVDGSNLPSGKNGIEAYGGADGIVIDGFTVRKSTRYGILLGENCVGGTIRACVSSENTNCGILTFSAPNSNVIGNTCYNNVNHGIYINVASHNTIVDGNLCYGNRGALHVNGDDGYILTGVIVRNNVFRNNATSGQSFMNAHDCFAYNNLYIDNQDYEIHLDSDTDMGPATGSHRNVVFNNTFIKSNGQTAVILSGGVNDARDCVVFNNICITTNGANAIEDYGTNDSVGNNLALTWSTAVLNDLFENYSAGDYHIKAGSGAHDTGVASFAGQAAPAFDMGGTDRPLGAGFDIGAYEIDENQDTYLLTIPPSQGGTVTKAPSKSTYTYEEQVVLTAVPNAGWSFTGWSGGLTGTQNPETLTITGNVTVTATFTQNASTPPGPPASPTLAETSPGCVTVSWQANTEADMAGYFVYDGLLSVAQGGASAYSDSVDAGNATSRQICSLSPGRHYFAVRAYDTSGLFSAYSAERSLYVTASEPLSSFEVGRWALSESSGGTADDSWGSFDGTLVNGPAWRPSGGQIDGALQFDGANDYVDIGTMDIPDGPGLSIAFWIRADDFDHPNGRFVSKTRGTAETDHYWMVSTVNSTGLRFRLKAGGVTTTLETSTGQVQMGQWYHITATYDGAKMRIYRNGTVVAETTKTGIVDTNSAAYAALGNQPAGAGTDLAFDGLLDDVRIYDRALTSTEIGSLIALATNSPPFASFIATPTSGFALLDVTFNASASDPEGDPLSFSWNFGDGTTGTGSNVVHEYGIAGTHQVVLTVSDDGGKTDTKYGSINVSESTGPPSMPVWQTLLETAPGCAALTWRPNTEPDLSGYVVYYGPLSVVNGETTSYSDSVDVGNTTTRTICAFSHGTYYFALRAYNARHELSGYSVEEHMHMAGPDLTGPIIIVASPENGAVDIDPIGTNVFVVLSDDRTGVDTSSVEVLIDGSAPARVRFNGDPSSYAAVCEPNGDLPPSATINVSVSVSDRASPPNVTTRNWSFTTGTVPPSAPAGLHAEGGNAGCVAVTWQANPETDLAGYTIYFGTSSVALGVASQYDDSLTVGSTTSHMVCGLIEGTYYFAMRAKNTSGQYSVLSGEVSADVTIAAPEKPRPPQQVQVSETSPGCLTVTWQANTETDLAGYVVYNGAQSVVAGDASQYEDSVDVANTRSKELFGLLAGPQYVAVRAYSTTSVFSDYSTEKRVDVVGDDLEPPAILVASPADGATDVSQNTEIFFVLSDARSGVDTTSLELRINGAAPSQITYRGDPSRYAVVCRPAGELPELTLVTVEVSVSDLASTPNAKSVTWSFTTGQSRPSKPEGITATGTDTGCAHLSWSANPEADVVGYRIYFGLESVEGGEASSYDDSASVGRLTSETLCGLLNGTYYFALRAKNALGHLSDYSQEVSSVITNPPVEGPTPPQQVQVSETSPGCVLVKWHANSEPDVTGYIIYHRMIGGPSEYTNSVDVGNVTQKKLCGYQEGAYCFVVRAYDSAGHFSVQSTEKWLDVVGPDAEGPKVVVGGPFHGAVDIRPSALVFFVVSDEKTGVDASSLTVSISGLPPAAITFAGDPSGYAVVCDPAGALPTNSTVRVSVTVRDLATPPNETRVSWSFSTGSTADISPPVFFSHTPGDGATGVDPMAGVAVGVRDKSGIDVSTISFYVNSVRVGDTSTREEVNGDIVIEYLNPEGFTSGSSVDIEIVVDDLAANRATLDFSFETSAATESGPVVAIVPDGYWAEDPSRPLEVRNIPPGWRVKIFNTAGLEVRNFRNDGGAAVDWTWDFANGSGRLVAKSMYLVRVVDDRGSVKKTGKFVVQKATR
jgi:uncharacterized repeat protein (TIGR02543 family)